MCNVLWSKTFCTLSVLSASDRSFMVDPLIQHCHNYMGYCFQLVKGLTYRIAHTMAFVTPVVEHWLKRKIAQWFHNEGLIQWPIAPWADALPWSYICSYASRNDVKTCKMLWPYQEKSHLDSDGHLNNQVVCLVPVTQSIQDRSTSVTQWVFFELKYFQPQYDSFKNKL